MVNVIMKTAIGPRVKRAMIVNKIFSNEFKKVNLIFLMMKVGLISAKMPKISFVISLSKMSEFDTPPMMS